MDLLKASGIVLLAAVITVLAFIGGIVLSLISTIVTILCAVGGVFGLVYLLIATESGKNDGKP